MSKETLEKRKGKGVKLLLVDSSSIAVTLFYAMGGAEYLEREEVEEDELKAFVTKVAEATVENIQRRVSLDGYQQVRMALESPPSATVWRYERYPDYKGAVTASDKPRVAKALQKPLVTQARQVGIPAVFSLGMEADDVIATMTYMVKESWDDMEISIWSYDKDLHQLLVHPNIKMIGKAGDVATKEDIETFWGHPAEAIPLIKALMGDSSDNIKGVAGVGLKTAAKMIRPAPHRKPCPFALDVDNLPESKRLQLLHEWARINDDTFLCTLRKDVELLPADQWRFDEND